MEFEKLKRVLRMVYRAQRGLSLSQFFTAYHSSRLGALISLCALVCFQIIINSPARPRCLQYGLAPALAGRLTSARGSGRLSPARGAPRRGGRREPAARMLSQNKYVSFSSGLRPVVYDRREETFR